MYLSTEKKDFEKMSDLQNSEKTIIYEEIGCFLLTELSMILFSGK